MYTWPLYYDLFIISVLYIYIIRCERILCTWQMYIYVCIWDVYICVQIDIYIYICNWATYEFIPLQTCVFTYLCVYKSCIYRHVYTTYIYIYIYIHIYIHIYTLL